MRTNRRDVLRLLGAAGAASLLAPSWPGARASTLLPASREAAPPRYLIVLTASGGASIIDGPLAIRASESATASTLNTFADPLVMGFDDSPFRAVDQTHEGLGAIPMRFQTRHSDFVRAWRHQMMVATWTRTSVNHAVGQRRAVTGNEAWAGRTIQELHALQHGVGYPLPNVHLVPGTAFTSRGTDTTLPAWAYGETIADPKLWPLSLDALAGGARPIQRELLAAARKARDASFDPATAFDRILGGASKLAHWRQIRETAPALETQDLVRRLMVFPDSPEFPLAAYGLSSSTDAEDVRAVFPKYDTDPLEAQAALAFLLLKNRVAVTVTLGPNSDAVIKEGVDLAGSYGGGLSGGEGPDLEALCAEVPDGEDGGPSLPADAIVNPPIGFDFSHQGNRSTQAFMWQRLYGIIDGLARLLGAVEDSEGVSMWDRTVVYVASDFGRTKNRPADAPEFGSGHDLNDGALVVSPLARGNTLLGGVDPDTALTYGFDPVSGRPEPGRTMQEAEIFAGLLGVCGIDTAGSGLRDVPAMRRS